VSSTRRQDVELGITFVLGPSADAGLPTRRVRVLVPELGWTRELAVQGGPERIRVPVNRGSTVISLEALDPQTVPIQPTGDTRPLIVGIQSLRIGPAPSPHLELVQVAAPNGLEQLNGQSFFWLGGPPASVLVKSTRRQDVELGITFVLGPSADPRLATRRVRALVPRLGWTREFAVRGGPEHIRIPVDLGNTVINLEALDVQIVPVQPNGDTRPLILGVQGLRVDPAP
jgi:hypothetical protein